MEIYPINHRKNWTEIEVNQLFNEIKYKLPIEKIALNHNRTINAIIYKIIRHLINNKKNKINYKNQFKFNINEDNLIMSIINKNTTRFQIIIIILFIIMLLQFIICLN